MKPRIWKKGGKDLQLSSHLRLFAIELIVNPMYTQTWGDEGVMISTNEYKSNDFRLNVFMITEPF